MGEFITIPLPNDDKWRCKRSFGLGFCKSSNEYKVIQTFSIMRHTYEEVKNYQEAEIYTIGTGEWRSTGIAPCKISSTLPINALLNESIHWIASSVRGRLGPLYSFNFRSEQFRLIPLPSVLDPNEKQKFKGYIMVGVIRDCLCISLTSDSKQCDMWIMKDYGVKESWTKMLVIENLSLSKNHYQFCEPIIESDGGDILMLCDNAVLVCYNAKTKRFRDAKISQTNGEFHIISYTPCFISLEDIVEEEEVKITRRRI